MAERKGFEPLVPVRVHTLSKRAPSTARPPLRKGREAYTIHLIPAMLPILNPGLYSLPGLRHDTRRGPYWCLRDNKP